VQNANVEIEAYSAQYSYDSRGMPPSNGRYISSINAGYVAGITLKDKSGNVIPVYPHVQELVAVLMMMRP